MTLAGTQRPDRRRAYAAVLAALGVHAVLLSSMALVGSKAVSPPADTTPDLQVELAPPLVSTRVAPATQTSARLRASTSPSSLSEPALPILPPPGIAPPSALSQAAGCDLEDLVLLTDQEKARCRNQLEAAQGRRAVAADDAGRAARVAAMRQAPRVDGIAPEKRGYYDAVQAAKAARNDFSIWDRMRQQGKSIADATSDDIVKPDIHDVVKCTMTFGANKGKPAGSRYGVRLGAFDCPLAPPVGAFTEEARIAPP